MGMPEDRCDLRAWWPERRFYIVLIGGCGGCGPSFESVSAAAEVEEDAPCAVANFAFLRCSI